MGTASGMVAEAAKHVGKIHEPSGGNIIHEWYNAHVQNLGRPNWSWCDAFVSYCAAHSDNMKAVCPAGGRAYTVWHAQDFQKRGQWHTGTQDNVAKARPGDIVFFDWAGSNSIGKIDHVGIVVRAHANGTVDTIEGNTSNACLRRTRSHTDIAGYGRPKYDGSAEGDDVSAKDVWEYGIDTGDGKKPWKASTVLGHLEKSQDETNSMLKSVQATLKAQDATIAELVKTVAQLAANRDDLDADELVATIQAAVESVKDEIRDIDVQLVVGEDGTA